MTTALFYVFSAVLLGAAFRVITARSPVHAALFLVLAFASAASAQGGPTPAQQAACRGDAMKFCASNVGKPEQMLACLRANKAQLSASCAQVIDAVN